MASAAGGLVFAGEFESMVACLLLSLAAEAVTPTVDFQTEIRPILSDNCFACHGPDEANRQAGLRLDDQDAAHEWAIVPGDADGSEILARILDRDPDVVMPPPEHGDPLTAKQVAALRAWIDAGAEYERHWAFVPPERPATPEVSNPRWVRNPIDAFVMRTLDDEGLLPSPPADRTTLLRRASLDLIGLPPTVSEVDAFLADRTVDAERAMIERLLQSPHFGERWARVWLDAARYADSDGYEKDKPRSVWFYRDWVVRAMNADMPYDRFITEQIAGDLLPEAGQDERVATGFLRNSMVNEEGGADPEQFRMEGLFDRVDAVGKGVLGLTLQCAQCHSHKYDPIAHDEYYRLAAFLNNTHDAIEPVYTDAERHRRDELLGRIAQIESELRSEMQADAGLAARFEDWQRQVVAGVGRFTVMEPVSLPFEGQKFRVLDDQSILSESYAPANSTPPIVTRTDAARLTGLRLELLTHPQLPRRGPGRSVLGTAALTEIAVEVAPVDDPDAWQPVKLTAATATVNPPERPQPEYLRKKAGEDDPRTTGPVAMAIDGDWDTAWTTDLDPGRRNRDATAVFAFEQPIGFEGGTLVRIKPTMNHGGWNSDNNHSCLMGRYRFSAALDDAPTIDPVSDAVQAAIHTPQGDRTDEQRAVIFAAFRRTVDRWSGANAEIDLLWAEHPEGTTQNTLEERRDDRFGRRETFVLDRGDFLSPTDRVATGVPSFLHPLPETADGSRLTLAAWLVDRESPTTARSIVNRLWQSYFGIGLVETSDDLGSQSTPPSHPELLDWLAVELMDSGWSLKHIHRLIVTSATYRQSSAVSPELHARDPNNRLLARGPRLRVDAEIVRDIMLRASGLLDPTLGGPPVYPPAPKFLFLPPASYGPKVWDTAEDRDRYRRGLYTFRFRSVPYPMLETFDAVPGNVSCVRRNRSNTPLQALVALNEPLAMECAVALADRAREHDGSEAERIAYAMRRCVAREPNAAELETLAQLLRRQRQRLSLGELDAASIVPVDEPSDERAAWTLLARVLLSLDETITKE